MSEESEPAYGSESKQKGSIPSNPLRSSAGEVSQIASQLRHKLDHSHQVSAQQSHPERKSHKSNEVAVHNDVSGNGKNVRASTVLDVNKDSQLGPPLIADARSPDTANLTVQDIAVVGDGALATADPLSPSTQLSQLPPKEELDKNIGKVVIQSRTPTPVLDRSGNLKQLTPE